VVVRVPMSAASSPLLPRSKADAPAGVSGLQTKQERSACPQQESSAAGRVDECD